MPVGQKFIHVVDAELSGDAQYRNYSNIANADLTVGSTVQFMPGTYEMGTINNADGITFQGLGDRAHVVLCNVVLGNGVANTVTFVNLTLSGNSGVAASSGRSIFITNGTVASTLSLKFRDVVFTNGDFGIDNQSNAPITGRFCDFVSVDRAIRSNANADFAFTEFNTSANAAFTGANAAPVKNFTYLASNTTSANTGFTLKTVRGIT